MVKKLFPFCLSFFYFVGTTIYITYPLIFHLTDYISGVGDELLITWILNWNIHAIFTNPLHIFDANIFYPYSNTLAFSDAFFTSTLFVLLPTLFLGEPVAAYNSNLLFTFVTLGFFTYLFVYYLTKNHLPSLVSGTLVAFSTFTVTKIMHPQVIGVQWVPLSLLFFLLFLKKNQIKYFAISMFFFVLQTANSFLPGYFLAFCFASIIGFRLFKKEDISLFLSRKVISIFCITGFVIFLLSYPYLQVSAAFDYVRDIRDTIHFANRPEYTFYPSDKTRLAPVFFAMYKDNTGPYFYEGYLGGVLFLGGIVSLWYVFIRKQYIPYTVLFSWIALSSFILSLGPALQWGGKVIKLPFIIPLPYALFYFLIPGFKGLRNSSRWEMLAVFALSVLIGLVLTKLLHKKKNSVRIVICFLLCFFVLLEFSPYTFKKVLVKNEFPSVYAFIQQLPKGTSIIELPIYNWNMPHAGNEFFRMYYSTLHFKPMVNGASGFSPIPWQKQTYTFATSFPNKETIEYLKRIGVDYIVIHKTEYQVQTPTTSFMSRETLEKKLSLFPEVTFVKQFGDDYVYKL